MVSVLVNVICFLYFFSVKDIVSNSSGIKQSEPRFPKEIWNAADIRVWIIEIMLRSMVKFILP